MRSRHLIPLLLVVAACAKTGAPAADSSAVAEAAKS